MRRDRAVSVRFGAAGELIQLGTDFPTTASGTIELDPPACAGVSYVSPHGALPLVLLSPASDKTINSIFGEFNLAHPRLAMHADDAAARGLRDGDAVRVFNDLGEVHVPVRLTRDLRRGVVTLPKGLWRSSTLNGSTATALVPDALTDIGAGACFNDARVDVARL